MTKKSFLDKLKSGLNVLKDEEVQEIIDEYESYINEEMHNGKTEEEAVLHLGDVDELINEILDAYKLKQIKKTKESRIVNILISVVLTVIFLLCLRVVIDIFDVVVFKLMRRYSVFYKLTSLILDGTYIVLSLSIILSVLTGLKNNLSIRQIFDRILLIKEKPTSDKVSDEKEIVGVAKNSKSNNFLDYFINFLILTTKFFYYLVIVLPMLVLICILSVITGAILYFSIVGYGLWGFSIVGIALVVLGILSLIIIHKLFKREQLKVYLLSFVAILVILGLGISLSIKEYLNFSYVDFPLKKETLTKEINQDLLINDSYSTSYQFVETKDIPVNSVYIEVTHAEYESVNIGQSKDMIFISVNGVDAQKFIKTSLEKIKDKKLLQSKDFTVIIKHNPKNTLKNVEYGEKMILFYK